MLEPTDLNAVILESFIHILNEALAADPVAMNALFEIRVPVNDALADHPTIVVADGAAGGYEMGVLGLLNGVAHYITGQRVCSVHSSNEKPVLRFDKFVEDGPT